METGPLETSKQGLPSAEQHLTREMDGAKMHCWHCKECQWCENHGESQVVLLLMKLGRPVENGGDVEGHQRLMERLPNLLRSEKKVKNYRQLRTAVNVPLLRAFQALVPFEKMWYAFTLGKLNNLLPLHCVPELTHYLTLVHECWTTISTHIDIAELDGNIIKMVQSSCRGGRQVNEAKLKTVVTSKAGHQLIEIAIGRKERLISLQSFFEDSKRLAGASFVLRELTKNAPGRGGALKDVLRQQYDGNEPDFEVQYKRLWRFATDLFPKSSVRELRGSLVQSLLRKATELGFTALAMINDVDPDSAEQVSELTSSSIEDDVFECFFGRQISLVDVTMQSIQEQLRQTSLSQHQNQIHDDILGAYGLNEEALDESSLQSIVLPNNPSQDKALLDMTSEDLHMASQRFRKRPTPRQIDSEYFFQAVQHLDANSIKSSSSTYTNAEANLQKLVDDFVYGLTHHSSGTCSHRLLRVQNGDVEWVGFENDEEAWRRLLEFKAERNSFFTLSSASYYWNHVVVDHEESWRHLQTEVEEQNGVWLVLSGIGEEPSMLGLLKSCEGRKRNLRRTAKHHAEERIRVAIMKCLENQDYC